MTIGAQVDLLDAVRGYWDADAATYDAAAGHGAGTAGERAAWAAALARHLPPPPARVLDVGAGTGFLSLAAARLGHRVTALDLSAGMLRQLAASAGREGLDVTIVHGPAHEPPAGPFDAVMERHLLWTLPDPVATLTACRAVAPGGRLLVFEGLWGAADPVEDVRGRLRDAVRRLRGTHHDHHAPYDPAWREHLPLLASGITLDAVVSVVERAGWAVPRLERLRDVEWAHLLTLPVIERVFSTHPRYLIRADA